MGTRSGARSGCGSVTATWCRAPPAGILAPASRPTVASSGPPVRTTVSVAIGPASVSTPVTRPAATRRPVNATRSRCRRPRC